MCYLAVEIRRIGNDAKMTTAIGLSVQLVGMSRYTPNINKRFFLTIARIAVR